VEIGEVSVRHQWKTVQLSGLRQFQHPVVIAGPPTRDGYDPCVVRIRSVTSDSAGKKYGFSAAIQEEEARKNSGHATETIGYLAVSTTTELALHQILCKNFFVTVASGYDTQVAVEEEKSKDSETNHINETVGVLFLNDQVFANMQTFNGSDTASMRRK